jgi:hypothetical protein
MKCRETKYWLYSLRPNTSWPADVVTHLQGCVKCQQIQAQLKQIDVQVNKLTNVLGGAQSKARLLQCLETTPQQAAPASPKSAWPVVRFLGYLTGAAALVALGWLLGRGENLVERDELPVRERIVEIVKEKPIEVVREKIIKVESISDRNLVASLLQRNARLVQSAEVKDRLDALLDMADDCRQYALTLIEQGPPDALPVTMDLYMQILRVAVPSQLQQAPAEVRPILKATTRLRLNKMAAAQEQKPLPQLLEEQRESLHTVTKEAIEHIDRPAPAPVLARKDPRPLPPAASLVQFAVAFSVEKEAVAKADSCSDCVQRLMPYMKLVLAEEATPQRGDMGQQFGEMIQFGIYAPLGTTMADEPAPPVKFEAERIFQSAINVVAEMEKSMATAPASTRINIKRVLDVAQKNKKTPSRKR